MPEASQKISRIPLKASHSSTEPNPKSITSSTNSRWVRESFEEIFMPLTFPVHLASSINRLIPYMTKMNKSKDNGQPCLRPREAGKKEEDEPLIKTAKLVEDMQPRIQLTPIRGTPI